MKNTIITFVFIVFSLSILAQTVSQEVLIQVEPGISKAIQGQLDLKREKYFNICHDGKWFESTINDLNRSNHYLTDLEMSFGRSLGLVYSEKNWGNSLKEDANRPGYADINYLRSKLNPKEGNPSTPPRSRAIASPVPERLYRVIRQHQKNISPAIKIKYTPRSRAIASRGST
jgi:hypothetical protein